MIYCMYLIDKNIEPLKKANHFNMTQRNTNHAAEIIYDHITYIVIAFVLPLICKSFTDQLNPEFSLSFQYVPIH